MWITQNGGYGNGYFTAGSDALNGWLAEGGRVVALKCHHLSGSNEWFKCSMLIPCMFDMQDMVIQWMIMIDRMMIQWMVDLQDGDPVNDWLTVWWSTAGRSPCRRSSFCRFPASSYSSDVLWTSDDSHHISRPACVCVGTSYMFSPIVTSMCACMCVCAGVHMTSQAN